MPESLGKTLRKIRESKKLSIEEVSERTRIPKKNIAAIEEDKLHEFSSVFYARNFVKSYSRFLGASEEKTVKDFLAGGPKKDTVELVLKKNKGPGENWFIKYKRPIGIGLAAIFGLWTLFFVFIKIGRFIGSISQKHKTQIVKKQEVKGKTAAPKPALPPQDLPKAAEGNRVISPPATAEKTDIVELEMTARYNAWIQVKGDGKLLFRGILKKKQSDVWRADKEISLELGNAGGVSLKLNGKNLGYAGKKGEKKKIIVTKDGIK